MFNTIVNAATVNTNNTALAAFDALDLAPIRMKLMHVESGEGWSAARAGAAETEYRRFLFLMKKYPDAGAAPKVDVDTFWHYHILDTMKYAIDCQAAFGYFLHHYPYVGIGADADAGEQLRAGETMRAIYAAEFGADGGAASAWCTRLGEADGAGGNEAANAWCTRTPQASANQANAWCTRVGETGSAIGSGKAAHAWCTRAGAALPASAWCTVPGQRFKGIGSAGAWVPGKSFSAIGAAPAWCTVTGKTAYAPRQDVTNKELAQAA